MKQIAYRLSANHIVEVLELPSAIQTVVPGTRWGRFTKPFTPAYWKALSWVTDAGANPHYFPKRRRDFVQETIFCILGGYGIKAEVAHAYFWKLSSIGIFNGVIMHEREIRMVLKAPVVHQGRKYGYRFPNQKARYLSTALQRLSTTEPPARDIDLRNWLLDLPGIGHKTAAWIVRNCCFSDNVAIIDVHLQRAGRLMKLFDSRSLSPASYSYFENRFLNFARALDVRASILDLLMWETMRQNLFFPPFRLR